uniref:Uncharacterized protein n=1 Tax=Panagrolaimus davidi TaxID=227884 RepID=A0A914PI19_9BILA
MNRAPRNRSRPRSRSSNNHRNYANRNIQTRKPYYNKKQINQTKKEAKTPTYSSLFFKLKDADNIPVRSYSDLSLDEICEILKNDKSEVNVFQALSSLYGLFTANSELFNEKFYDCIMPLIGELFKWEENVGDAFIFMFNKVFDAVYRLPDKTIWGCFNKLCEYVLHGLQNKQSKIKVLSLHILQTHIFPRCPATMNKDLYYQYLDFLSRDCIIGKVNFDVIRAALITLPEFLEIYLRDNDSTPEDCVEIVIHNNQITCLSQNPQIEFDYTFGGTIFYDIPQSYPTNSKSGIALLGLCCFKFFSRIIVIENFQLKDYYEYMADGLHFINLIIKRYVSDNEIPKGRYGNAFIKLTNDLGFMIHASQNTILSPYLRNLHEI